MPKVEMFDKNQALMRALNLFWSKGYEATSLSDLTQELEIGKGSFYNTFGNKKQLFQSCLEVYRSKAFETLNEVLQDKTDVTGGLEHFLNFHTKTMLDDPSSKGCLIANSTTELSHDSDMKKFLLEHNEMMRLKLSEYLDGSKYEERKEGLVDSILIYVTGISVITKFNKDPERYRKANENFLKSIL